MAVCSSFESRVVFLYDTWAERMKFLQRHVSAVLAVFTTRTTSAPPLLTSTLDTSLILVSP